MKSSSTKINFFQKRPKSPTELIRAVRDLVAPGGRLDGSTGSYDGRKKTNEELSKLLAQIKTCLYGDSENDVSPEGIAQLAQEAYSTDVLLLLIERIGVFEFEAKKDVTQIFNHLLRRQIGSRFPTVEYISKKPQIIFATLKGYSNEDVALNTGMMLKEMLKYESLAQILLYSEQFYTFPSYIENTTFGISCDVLGNLKELLTKHKPMVASFLDKNYDRFFSTYTTLILSSNYVTKRQSIKLLGEILLDRANYKVMTRYIANEANLKMMMILLRDKSKNIQFEAFHVFKVFVANPNKPPPIVLILQRNKDKLLSFLKNFHNDKDGSFLFPDTFALF
ncbi:Conserved protein Mo25 [Phaffia rhodozyma]|uniref:Conserved protein Mo25 n=1 Tax=Phaffia rhodozyma TaxID=264483 RepID=A0A0F7SFG6_PHARH|nr:Conserved protein Mo25 [Phaffia rhodozyma]